MFPNCIKVEKPWGYELIFTTDKAPVTAKMLHLNKGGKLSLQYHQQKEECLILFQGEANIIIGKDKNNLSEVKMEKLKGYFINKLLVHRCLAVTDCDIFEASTPEFGTTVRISDDYSRSDETDEDRLKLRK